MLYKINMESTPEVRYSGQITYGSGWTNNGHIRPRSTLFFVVSGEMHVTLPSHSVDLSGGDYIIIPADTFFTVSMLSKSSFRYIHFSLCRRIEPSDRAELECCAKEFSARQQTVMHTERLVHTPADIFVNEYGSMREFSNQLDPLFRQLDRRKLTEGMLEKRRLDLTFSSILLLLSEATLGDALPAARQPEVMSNMLMWISRHFKEHITLDDMSRRFNFSKQHIIRLFNVYKGQSVIQYINGYRLQKSLEMLSNTDIQIGEVARELGFGSSYYFSRLFTRAYEITPSEYRNKHK